MAQKEFVLLDKFQHTLRWWWLIVAAGLLGGTGGYLIHRLFQPSLYEAQAVFVGTLSIDRIPLAVPSPNPDPKITPTPYQITEYDEDIMLAMIQAALNEVRPQVAAAAQQKSLPVDLAMLNQQGVIERHLEEWFVRFRHADPRVAQEVTNLWAQMGLEKMKAYEQSGLIKPYVVYKLANLAELPTRPLYFQNSLLIFGGLLVGMAAGLILINLLPDHLRLRR
jgi:hypothetical protein